MQLNAEQMHIYINATPLLKFISLLRFGTYISNLTYWKILSQYIFDAHCKCMCHGIKISMHYEHESNVV